MTGFADRVVMNAAPEDFPCHASTTILEIATIR